MALVDALRHPLQLRSTCFSCTIEKVRQSKPLPSVRIGRLAQRDQRDRLIPPPWPSLAGPLTLPPKLKEMHHNKKGACRGAVIARAATKTAQKAKTETEKEDAGCLAEEEEAEPQDGNGASLQVEEVELPPENESEDASVSFTVVGATGHLATQEIFPALFALYYKDCLPKNFFVFGYARSKSNDKQFRELILTNLNCRLSAGTKCPQQMDSFLKRCFYEQGYYDTCTGMAKLDKRMKQLEGGRVGNRVFYLSVPPDVVVDVATCLSVTAPSRTGWTRVIVEKPFGSSGETSKAITQGLQEALSEEQIYRIDHFLGKELIDNLTVLRFANLIFEPLWCRDYIKNVQIVFTEDSGVDVRGKHLNQYGVIRDIVQSHVLQVLALFAMEQPVSLSAEDIRDEKVKVLKSLRRPTLDEVALGQYKARTNKAGETVDPGYLDEPDVPPNSLAPTFAAMAFYIDNARWDGVPFLVKTGQAMRNQRNEIRIQFKGVPGNLYREHLGYNAEQQANELVIRVQPDEAIYVTINNKVPGLGVKLDQSRLNLLYRQEYNNDDIPDSYERLLLDVVNGDKRLFIRADELAAAWEVLDPVLQEIDDREVVPELYTYGSRGPIGAYYLAAKQGGVRWADLDDL